MLNIERMQIRLPAGYEHRASYIMRMVGESLADYRPVDSRYLDNLTIGPLQVSPISTDSEIASKIAQQIKDALGSRL